MSISFHFREEHELLEDVDMMAVDGRSGLQVFDTHKSGVNEGAKLI